MTSKSQQTESSPYANRDHEVTMVDDTLAVAQLFNTVGSELTTVDHHTVVSGSMKAQRLDPSVVMRIEQPREPQSPLRASEIPVHEPTLTETVHEQNISISVANPPPSPASPVMDSKSVAEIIQAVNMLEDKIHTHYDSLERKVSELLDIHSNIIKQLVNSGAEVTVKPGKLVHSEDTD